MSASTHSHVAARPALVWAALGIVYVVWGSTYFAIRVAIDTLPPFLMAAARFLIAGGLLLAVAAWRGARTPDRSADRVGWAQWRAALIVGAALLGGGNGGVVWAEQRIPSGVAALLVATVALWFALLDRVFYGKRLARQAGIGLGLGLAGLALLVGPAGQGEIDSLGALACTLASLSWAAGSLYARGAPLPHRPIVATGMQMAAGGLVLLVLAVASGELAALRPAAFSTASLLALAYLVVFGSLVAFSAYVWLLRAAPVALVATYAYVNPVVAVLLGWALLSEPVTARMLVAGGIIVVAVALIAGAMPPEAPPDDDALVDDEPRRAAASS